MNSDDPEQILESLFTEAFILAPEQEEASWLRFREETLPEKQAWAAFSAAITEANRQVRQATQWAHWATGRSTDRPVSGVEAEERSAAGR